MRSKFQNNESVDPNDVKRKKPTDDVETFLIYFSFELRQTTDIQRTETQKEMSDLPCKCIKKESSAIAEKQMQINSSSIAIQQTTSNDEIQINVLNTTKQKKPRQNKPFGEALKKLKELEILLRKMNKKNCIEAQRKMLKQLWNHNKLIRPNLILTIC